MCVFLDKRPTNNGDSTSQVLLEEQKSTFKEHSYEVCVVCLYPLYHRVTIVKEDLVDDNSRKRNGQSTDQIWHLYCRSGFQRQQKNR
jgi:hypothetical protein